MMINLKEKYIEWCNMFLDSVEEMDKELTKIFLRMSMMEILNEKHDTTNIENTFMFKIIDSRSKYINLDISIYLKIFLLALVKTPGEITMFLYYIKRKMVESGKPPDQLVTFVEFSSIFPNGFPTKESLENMWKKQKIHIKNCGDNLLDLIRVDEIQTI